MSQKSLLYDRIYMTLKQQIQTGYYKPGEMIPSEQELMDLFGVSRVTTTRALRRLVSEGLIIRKVGAGTFVNEAIAQKGPDDLSDEQLHSPTNLIGLVIPHIWGDYSLSLLTTAERILQQRGMVLAVACSYGRQDIELRRIEEMVSLNVRGLIVFPTDGTHYNAGILRLYVEQFPTVIVDKELPGVPFPYVTSDNYNGAKRLTEHLLELGHRQIGFLSISLEGTSTLSDRYAGFLDALRESDVVATPEHYLDSLQLPQEGEMYDEGQLDHLRNFVRDHPEVTAVFASRYEIAEHVYKVAKELGRNVPDDLTVVCFDGVSPTPTHWQFTHMAQDGRTVASEALRMLFDLLEGKVLNSNHITIPTKFHVGNTSSPNRVSGSIL